MPNFEHLKVGDHVTRLLGGMPMPMIVTKVDGDLITCAAIITEKDRQKFGGAETFNGGWTFDRKTGAEEDHEIGWGVKFGHTGSYLVEAKNDNA
jgi:hypothetical protein